MSQRVQSPRWFAMFPVVYFVHLLDERYFWIGTAEFATEYLGIYFTNGAWWAVNVPSLILLTTAAIMAARGSWPQWVGTALGVHLACHGLGRVPTLLWTMEIAPGLVTGLLLCTPLAAAALWRGYTSLHTRDFAIGIVVGNLSFQPFWHFALWPLLPSAPTPL